jgi:hypothetical protein
MSVELIEKCDFLFFYMSVELIEKCDKKKLQNHCKENLSIQRREKYFPLSYIFG